MSTLVGQSLVDAVESAYQESEQFPGAFTRGYASNYLKIRGFRYNSEELSRAVKEVKEAHNVTSARITFKTTLLAEVGETIFNKEHLDAYLLANDKDPEEERRKYMRYVEVAERGFNKGLEQAKKAG